MCLLDLEPRFLQWVDDTHHRYVDVLQAADGVIFVCPGCLKANNMQRPGVHSVICWQPNVPQTTNPVPGRWKFSGTGLGDLTLTAGSSSVAVGCKSSAHFFIQQGEIKGC